MNTSLSIGSLQKLLYRIAAPCTYNKLLYTVQCVLSTKRLSNEYWYSKTTSNVDNLDDKCFLRGISSFKRKTGAVAYKYSLHVWLLKRSRDPAILYCMFTLEEWVKMIKVDTKSKPFLSQSRCSDWYGDLELGIKDNCFHTSSSILKLNTFPYHFFADERGYIRKSLHAKKECDLFVSQHYFLKAEPVLWFKIEWYRVKMDGLIRLRIYL